MSDSVMVRLAVILVSIIVLLFTWTAVVLTDWCLWAIGITFLLTTLFSGIIYVAIRW